MKKVLVLLLSLSVFTACNDEPVEGYFAALDSDEGTIPGNTTDELKLASYTYDVETEAPFIGPLILNSDFNFNDDNKVNTLNVETIAFGFPFTTTGTVIRDTDGKITAIQTFDGSALVSQTDIFYSAGNTISQITHDDFDDNAEDYTFNFTTLNNQITKTEPGNPVTTVYTADGSGKLIDKSSFEAGELIQSEILTYDANDNCISVVSTGEFNNTTTYGFDSFSNPLKDGFSDQYWLSILDDDYEDEAGPAIVQFHGSNNWNSVSSEGTTVTLMINYDSTNRITSRSGVFSLSGIEIVQEEAFNYVN
ncbi:hypothetical protein [Olleya sp. 1-3]|uniref:hypothetical protein n=1 Tax=Olleya sp. 1-3 TaxID=2058323 RepID=UPI000C34F64A|nr:hypothetical protein [Olleya sp. 1-3]PKG49806.1 hypothetical protein CXF54_13885 [Olleya sp. 1-3]